MRAFKREDLYPILGLQKSFVRKVMMNRGRIILKDCRNYINNTPNYSPRIYPGEMFRQTGRTTEKMLDLICYEYDGLRAVLCFSSTSVAKRQLEKYLKYKEIVAQYFGPPPQGGASTITSASRLFSHTIGSQRAHKIIYDLD